MKLTSSYVADYVIAKAKQAEGKALEDFDSFLLADPKVWWECMDKIMLSENGATEAAYDTALRLNLDEAAEEAVMIHSLLAEKLNWTMPSLDELAEYRLAEVAMMGAAIYVYFDIHDRNPFTARQQKYFDSLGSSKSDAGANTNA